MKTSSSVGRDTATDVMPTPSSANSRGTNASPEALKASVGADRVVLGTADNDAALTALRDDFGIEATVAEGAVTFHIENGEVFVPRLFAELSVAITSIAVSRPTLDDVFMRYTGATIRDAETGTMGDHNRTMMRAMAGAKR